MLYALLYVTSIVAVNYGFSVTTPWETPYGVLPPMTFLAGAVFVLRDYAQRYVGHNVLWFMVAATILSYYMADPIIAGVSALAFALSELVDWLIYTVTKKPLHKRILVSSLIGTPVDTVVFLGMLGWLSLPAALLMFASKMVAAVVVYIIYEVRE